MSIEKSGRPGAGRLVGSAPITASGDGRNTARTVTITMPTSDPGIERCQSGNRYMHAPTTATAANDQTR